MFFFLFFVFCIFVLLLVILLFKMPFKHSAEVLFSVPMLKKSLMCLTEKKKCVFDKLCSGMSYSAVGSKFNVNVSTMYIKEGFFKQKHI